MAKEIGELKDLFKFDEALSLVERRINNYAERWEETFAKLEQLTENINKLLEVQNTAVVKLNGLLVRLQESIDQYDACLPELNGDKSSGGGKGSPKS